MEELLNDDYKFQVKHLYGKGSQHQHMMKSKDTVSSADDMDYIEKTILLCEFRKKDIPNLIQFLINCEQKMI